MSFDNSVILNKDGGVISLEVVDNLIMGNVLAGNFKYTWSTIVISGSE